MALPDCIKAAFPKDYHAKLPTGVPVVQRPTPDPEARDKANTVGPAEATWYFPVDLEHHRPTGVFLPQGFSYQAGEVDVILFFHGNKQGNFTNVDRYWHKHPSNINLREDLNASKKMAILVVPTMGENPGHGGSDNLDLFRQPGAAACYLQHVLQWLVKYDTNFPDRESPPAIRKLVLAGHSGGGFPIILQMAALKEMIDEIWCFDTIYGDPDAWVNYASHNPTKRVTIYHAIQSLDVLAKIVEAKKKMEDKRGKTIYNLEILKGANEHFHCLTDNFGKQINRSTLSNKPQP